MTDNKPLVVSEKNLRAALARASRAESRVAKLERTLVDVWIWTATEPLDLDALLVTLRTADRQASLLAALDQLEKRQA